MNRQLTFEEQVYLNKLAKKIELAWEYVEGSVDTLGSQSTPMPLDTLHVADKYVPLADLSLYEKFFTKYAPPVYADRHKNNYSNRFARSTVQDYMTDYVNQFEHPAAPTYEDQHKSKLDQLVEDNASKVVKNKNIRKILPIERLMGSVDRTQSVVNSNASPSQKRLMTNNTQQDSVKTNSFKQKIDNSVQNVTNQDSVSDSLIAIQNNSPSHDADLAKVESPKVTQNSISTKNTLNNQRNKNNAIPQSQLSQELDLTPDFLSWSRKSNAIQKSLQKAMTSIDDSTAYDLYEEPKVFEYVKDNIDNSINTTAVSDSSSASLSISYNSQMSPATPEEIRELEKYITPKEDKKNIKESVLSKDSLQVLQNNGMPEQDIIETEKVISDTVYTKQDTTVTKNQATIQDNSSIIKEVAKESAAAPVQKKESYSFFDIISEFDEELRQAGYSEEAIMLFDYSDFHDKMIKQGIYDRKKRIEANKKKKEGETKDEPTKAEQYLRLFPGKRDKDGYREDDADIFEWLQSGHKQSDPTRQVSENDGPEGKVLKNAIRVAIVVPEALDLLDSGEAKEQIRNAQEFLRTIDDGQNLVADVVYSDDKRLKNRVSILPVNTKGDIMFTHHDGILSDDNKAAIGAMIGGGGSIVTYSALAGLLSNPVGWAAIGAGVAGGAFSMLDNYAYNHNWWGISDNYQIPITIDHAFEQTLGDKNFKYNDPRSVYNVFDNIDTDTEVGHRTSKLGWGTKHYVGETTIDKTKQMILNSDKTTKNVVKNAEKRDVEPFTQAGATENTQGQQELTPEQKEHQQRIREQEERDRKKREKDDDERLTKLYYSSLTFR